MALIDLAIDNEEHNECEDWTSKLGINLRYCVNVKNNTPSKQVPWTLASGTLFSDKRPGSEISSLNWQSQRTRSKRSNRLAQTKPYDRSQRKKDDPLEGRVDGSTAKKKLIQYSRRRFKSKQSCLSVASMVHEFQEKSKNESAVLSGDHSNCVLKDGFNTENFRSDCVLSCVSASTAMTPTHTEIQIAEVPTTMRLHTGTATPPLSNSFPDDILMTEKVGAVIGNKIIQKLNIDGENDLTPSRYKMHHNTNVSEICGKVSLDCPESPDKKCSSSLSNATDRNVDMFGKNQNAEAIIIDSIGNSLDLDDKGHQEYQSSCKSNKKETFPSADSLVNQPTVASRDGSSESPYNNNSAERISNAMPVEETTEEEINSKSERGEEPPSDDKPNGEVGEVPIELYAAEDLHDTVILDVEQCQIQNKNRINEESTSGYVAKGDNRSETLSEIGCSEVSVETCPEKDSCTHFTSDRENEMEIQPVNCSDVELCPGAQTALKDSSVSIQECSQIEKMVCGGENRNGSEDHLSQENRELESCELNTAVPRSNAVKKRRMKVEETTKNQLDCHNFIRGPCEGLRPRRAGKIATEKSGVNISQSDKENPVAKRARRHSEVSVPHENKKDVVTKPHKCDLDGCHMSFMTKAELQLHKRNLCPHKGCGKKFSSHRYAIIHQRVHEDKRPLKCPWKGCSMSFKWAWARIEHLRLHTGEKPYQCKVEGCGLSFRYVSDFSRHRRKTGHYVKSPA